MLRDAPEAREDTVVGVRWSVCSRIHKRVEVVAELCCCGCCPGVLLCLMVMSVLVWVLILMWRWRWMLGLVLVLRLLPRVARVVEGLFVVSGCCPSCRYCGCGLRVMDVDARMCFHGRLCCDVVRSLTTPPPICVHACVCLCVRVRVNFVCACVCVCLCTCVCVCEHVCIYMRCVGAYVNAGASTITPCVCVTYGFRKRLAAPSQREPATAFTSHGFLCGCSWWLSCGGAVSASANSISRGRDAAIP